jgi:glycosyltransferase involved in cell wall biosynthesis
MTHSSEPAACSTATLWYDVTDVVKHQATWVGIPRVVGGLALGLIEGDHPFDLRFCHFRADHGFVDLTQKQIEKLIFSVGKIEPQSPVLAKLQRFFSKRVRRKKGTIGLPFSRGDILFNAGFNSYGTKSQKQIHDTIKEMDIKYIGYIHDLIFYRFPEMWSAKSKDKMRSWMEFLARSSSLILCSSTSTKRDAEEYFSGLGIPWKIAPTGLASGLVTEAGQPRPANNRKVPGQPYVLCVSTLEVRKNHRLLFHVWKNLIEKFRKQSVHLLVIERKKGWLIDDFISELENCEYLDGAIQWLSDVDDTDLVALYQNCLFTVYPSLYEGWGLPIAESLSFGKYCVASNSSSLPEVGGTLIDYHKPFDVETAAELVARAIRDREFLPRREMQIRQNYRPCSWQECASAAVAVMADLLRPATTAK